MANETIDHKLIEIALDKIDGNLFENFVNAFYPAIEGIDFIPLGGMKDGGADAWLDKGVWESTRMGVYYQASTEENYSSKIQRTIKRLKEFGRKPNRLIYITSRQVPYIDEAEERLTSSLDCIIKIRERDYIVANVNRSAASISAFKSFLAPKLSYLRQIGTPDFFPTTLNINFPAIYVYLRQEVERSQGKDDLLTAMADSLILWALEGTDPENQNFLSELEILTKINSAIPKAEKILKGVLPHRLQALSRIPKGSGRSIRYHRKQKKYTLAYDLRKELEEENTEDESLRIRVVETFKFRITESAQDQLDIDEVYLAVDIALKTIHRAYEQEGLEFASFVEGDKDSTDFPTIADHVDKCLEAAPCKPEKYYIFKDVILDNLRAAFYDSTPHERSYFNKLSTTYTLLFTLNVEPRVIEYFQNMASDFYLYVGTDLIIRALSERYLRPEDQMARNAFKILKESGATLVLTDPVLDEVYTHIAATDYEYQNHYNKVEELITEDVARQSDRILIRAYYYARFNPPAGIISPRNWLNYINQFADYNILHKPQGRDSIKSYIMAQFGFRYETKSEIMANCDMTLVDELKEKLMPHKNKEEKALNDALMVYSVYARRQIKKEHSSISEYGFRTWWLTNEQVIIQFTKEIVKTQRSRYMMRPEFILNYLTLTPSAAEARLAYKEVFPTMLGIRLARRVDQQEVHKVLSKLQEALDLEPGRRVAAISAASDKLKSDFLKKYDGFPNNG